MRRSSRPSGFTLIELLVSLTIVGVVTGLMMANYRGGQQHSEVRFASEILVSQLRALQTEALSGKLIRICSGGSNDKKVCETKSPPVACTGGTCQRRVASGYGLRLTGLAPYSYLVFYDGDDDLRYDPGEELSSQPFVSTNTVKVADVSVGLPVDIVFKPPFAQLAVNGVTTGPDLLTINLAHERGSSSRNVKIFRIAGKIEHD
jgi:prepilin-type N-terminal cleavage/methylation domain-containing protein